MFLYIVKRVGTVIFTLWVIVTITFFAMHAIPGDPFTDANRLPPEIIANLKAQLGLDRPVPEQYVTYLKNVVKGDLGISIKYRGRSVASFIADGWPVSATLGLITAIFAVVVGLVLGVFAGIHNRKFWDYLIMIISVVGVSVPSFVFAAGLQMLFGVKLGWLPVARWGTPARAILPMLALGLGTIAFLCRMVRTCVMEVQGQDYVKTAKSLGLRRHEIIRTHILRNSLVPTITVLGPMLAGLICGTFVIEKIFAIPGLGKYYIMSIQESDYTMIMGLTIFYATILLVMTLLVDIVYGLVDPRIKLNRANRG